MHGSADRRLEIAYADAVLTVRTVAVDSGDVVDSRSFTGFSKVEWAYLRNDRQEPVGVVFTLVPEAFPGRPVTITTRFGASPLGKVYQ